jgi:hypothetical protein
MNKINEEIEQMAEKMEKASKDHKERLFDVIKSLGAEGLKAKLPTLSDEDKTVLKAALEEMTLKKAVSFDDVYAAKFVQGNIKDTIIQEDKADDDADEKLVKPAANKHNHQGGWDGQVIKSLEERLDEVVEKAMEKCNDDKMVMKKLKEKGMDEGKVQGALDKYKMKKDMKKSEEDEIEKAKKMDKEQAKDKIMAMEEKEHGTKDPKKLVEAEKKEHKEDKKKDMKKSVSWEDETRLLKANTQGRNFNFNVEKFIEETIANEPKEETVKKSESDKEDLNDLIAKGKDMSWNQVNKEKMKDEAKKKQNGKVVKSFSDEELAEAMGMSVEEARKILE